jgi:hypothetical protein
MPDTFTHIALPFIFRKYLKSPLIPSIFLIGTVLPDYFRELLKCVLPFIYQTALYPLHSFIGVLLMSVLTSAFFHSEIRGKICLNLFLGQVLHLLFDTSQGFIDGRLYLLYPLRKSFEMGLISESNWLAAFFVSAGCFLIYSIIFISHKAAKHTTK